MQESSQRSSNISWFDHVQFACASTQSKFEPRFYEGKSLSSIMPSVKKVMKVSFALPGMGTQSHLPTIRLNELQTIGYQTCPDVGKRCCGAGENLGECLGVLHFPVEDDDGFIPFFWRLRPDSPGAVAFVATRRGESFLSHMVPSTTEAQKRNLLSDPIFQQEDLFAPATLDAARHAARDVSLYQGAQSRPSTSSETTQRRQFSSSPASRGRTQSSSAPATPQRSQASSSSKRFTLQKRSPDPPRGFSGVGVCPLFVVHHRPIHPEHLHRIPAISHGSLHHGRSLLSVRGAVLRVDNCPSCLYTADGSNILHSPSLQCQDAQTPRRLVDSSRIQDHWSPGKGQAPASV